ncbi:hypothetical protein PFISCL1PPCAC_13744, partial [Pristionchus fissidentatus]
RLQMDQLPTPEAVQEALLRQKEREERETRVFSSKVDREEAAHCRCECCPPRNSLEDNDYCCSSLFSLALLKKGVLFRDGLISKLQPIGAHSCISRDPHFVNYILTDLAARSSAETFSMMTGTPINDLNRSLRYGAYRTIISSTIGHLGKGVRIRLPACVIAAVRAKWPSNNYTGF